ncbi:hypothetical protein [Planctobacterium marinum]|uniref:YdhG-like domain-containing protein n=1 Tax=Planctobacterium marinum TaxID=1631968 RepID=A0AA48HT23_9ALTE|nr:hypothetical protein MACH26_29900 [Planctobacterium marinum]
MNQSDFVAVFTQLKQILTPYAASLDCIKDTGDDYYLNSRHIMKNKKALFFAAVNIKKRYVSFHLMPVYVFPELLDTLSPQLKKRMQGKSCFNFTRLEKLHLDELSALTSAGYRKYQDSGYVP